MALQMNENQKGSHEEHLSQKKREREGVGGRGEDRKKEREKGVEGGGENRKREREKGADGG